jgi:cellulose synthase/poly-beta-1,6-N-acetylglucosamine synthase-like glycosyltransferase
MEQLFYIVFWLFLAMAITYVFSILFFGYGWLKTPQHIEINDELSIKVTVIIAARNEEYNIAMCLRALVNQSYPTTNMEVIVVDDNSEDTTAKHIQRFCDQYHFVKLISLNGSAGEFGKKKAIQKAIAQSTGEVIVTTDADCVMDMDWLRLLISFQTRTNAQLVAGPVCFHREKTVFEKMQSLEFMALIASTAGAMHFNKAILCNGANLMYTRKAYEEVNGFEGIDSGPSGDDVLLMYKIKKRFPGRLKFLKNEDAIVYTKAKKDVNAFLHQRRRWASKKFSQLNAETIALSSVIYGFNLLLIALPLIYLLSPPKTCPAMCFLKTWLLVFSIKCIIDFLLLFLAANFFKKKKWLILFIPEQLIYIPYVVYTGLSGMIGKYDWKGRKIKN